MSSKEPKLTPLLSLDDLELDLEEISLLKEKILPFRHLTPEELWTPIARVLIIQRTLCRCGATFESPGAKTLLIRNKNSRTDAIWEHEMEIFSEGLPLERREIISQVHICQHCVNQPNTTH